MTDRNPAACRVALHADSRRVDLVLPAGVPVAELIPAIVDIVCPRGNRHPDRQLPVPYRLSLPGSTALDDTKPLAEQGVRDGALLLLSRDAVEPPAPRFDDPAEQVATTSRVIGRPWTAAAARLAAATATAWFIAIGLLVTARWGATAVAAAAAAAAGCTLTGAVLVDRLHRDRATALTLGVVAVGLAATAGFVAVPGAGGPENVLLSATAAGATAGVLLTVSVGGVTAMTAAAGLAALVGAAALTMSLTGAPLPAVTAVLAVTAVALLQVAGAIAAALGGLTRRPAAELSDAAISRAQQLLTGVVIAFAAAAAAGALGAVIAAWFGQASRPAAVAFVTTAGTALALQTRAQTGRGRIIAVLTAGVGLLGGSLLAAADAAPRAVLAMAVALAATSGCGTVAGLPGSTIRRGLDLLEYLALIALMPLAGWLSGCFGAVRGLSWG